MRRIFAWAAHRWHVNPSLVRLEAEVSAFAESLKEGSAVLDAGAGDCRYRSHFGRHRYESADFVQVESKQYGDITYVCDLRSIPVPEARFDALICTQVLAHLPDPRSVLCEFHRVLRPGGKMLLSCPLFFHENEKPHDYFRYTQFGLRRLLSHAGFAIDRLEWLEGYYGTFSYQLGTAALSLPLSAAAYGGGLIGHSFVPVAAMLKIACAAGCQVFTLLELRHKQTSSGQCINYCVHATTIGAAPDTALRDTAGVAP